MTTRRTIRIEVTDQSDELEDHFTGPREREHATLVRELAADPLLDKSPADLLGALAEWLDGQPRRIEEPQQCDFAFREYHPPKLCILPMGHSSSEHTTVMPFKARDCGHVFDSGRSCVRSLGHGGLHSPITIPGDDS